MATAKKASTAVAVVAKKPANGVVSVKDMMAAQLAALAGKTEAAGGGSIRINNNKTFTLPDGTETETIKVVIIDFTSQNRYYAGAYNSNAVVPPNCFAIGDIPTQLVPSANSPEPKCDTCSGCPQNQFGSGNNGSGKACKNSRVMAVVDASNDKADAPIWTLTASPTAIKAFDGYVKNVQRMFNVPPVGVVTEVSFDPNSTYASIRFGDPEPNQDVETHFGRMEEAREILEREPDVSSFGQTPKAAPKKMPAGPANRAAPAKARR